MLLCIYEFQKKGRRRKTGQPIAAVTQIPARYILPAFCYLGFFFLSVYCRLKEVWECMFRPSDKRCRFSSYCGCLESVRSVMSD